MLHLLVHRYWHVRGATNIPLIPAAFVKHDAGPTGTEIRTMMAQQFGTSDKRNAVHESTESPGQLRLEEGGNLLAISGEWTLRHYPALQHSLAGLPLKTAPQRLDFTGLERLDTSGAILLARLLGTEWLQSPEAVLGLSAERRTLLRTVGGALERLPPQFDVRSSNAVVDVLAQIGRTSEAIWQHITGLLGFMGLTLAVLTTTLLRPRRWRITGLVNQVEQTGLNAVPIVALLTFLVGAVVAFLGNTVLAEFGASIYTVDLVAYSFMREFGVLLAAILLAGRTASAFAAQIGSMKANEEIDALRVQGLHPIELLVLPRVLGLMITLPMLTFIAVVSGLTGGATVSLLVLDIPVPRFLGILEDISLRHFLVGMVKAPVFAFLIALVGCLEGFRAGGNAESVGAHTTSAVVQSIFLVILLDALAALFFVEIGW